MKVLSKKAISVFVSLFMFFVAVLGFVSVCSISASARVEITVYTPTRISQQLTAGVELGWDAEPTDTTLIIGKNINPNYEYVSVSEKTYREIHVTPTASFEYFWAQALYVEANGTQHYSDRAMFTGIVAPSNSISFYTTSGLKSSQSFNLSSYSSGNYFVYLTIAYCGEYSEENLFYQGSPSFSISNSYEVNGLIFTISAVGNSLTVSTDRTVQFNTCSSTINQCAAVGIAFVSMGF